MTYRPFSEAREYVRELKLKNVTEWRQYYGSGQKPDDIPSVPEQAYKKQWKGYGDWLGTGRLATKDLEFLSFEQARQIARSLKFKSNGEYKEYCRSKNRHLPVYPTLYMKRNGRDGETFWAQVILRELTESSGRFQEQENLSIHLD